MRRLPLLVLLALLVLPSLLPAEWTSSGIPLTTQDESVIAVVPGQGGTAWVGWNDQPSNSGFARVCVQHFSPQGVPLFDGRGLYLETDPAITSDLLGAVRSGRDNLLVFYSLSDRSVGSGVYAQIVTSQGTVAFEERHLVAMTDVELFTRQGNYQVASDRAGGGWLLFINTERDLLKLVGINVDGSLKTDEPVLVEDDEFEAGHYRLTERDDQGVWTAFVTLRQEYFRHKGYYGDGSPVPGSHYSPSGPFVSPILIVPSGFGGYYDAVDEEDRPVFEWYSPQLNYEYSSISTFDTRFGVKAIVPGDVDGEVAFCGGNVFTDSTIGVYNHEITIIPHRWEAVGSALAVYDTSAWSGLYEILGYATENDRFSAVLEVVPDVIADGFILTPRIRRHAVDLFRNARPCWEYELTEQSWHLDEIPEFPERWCWMLENDCVLMLLPQESDDSVRNYMLYHIDPDGQVTEEETDLDEVSFSQPDNFALLAAYPNPFNMTTRIEYHLPFVSHIRLSIYDLLGRELQILDVGIQSAGDHTEVWNPGALSSHLVSSGIYLVRLQAGSRQAIQKVVLVK